MKYQIDIYENDGRTPTLSHVFYGTTQDEIAGVVTAHANADAFLRAALTTGNYRGIPLRVTSEWFTK